MIEAIEVRNVLNAHWKKDAEITHVLLTKGCKYTGLLKRKAASFNEKIIKAFNLKRTFVLVKNSC